LVPCCTEALLHDSPSVLLTETLCSLLSVLVDAVNEQRGQAAREGVSPVDELEHPDADTWPDVLQAYIDQQPQARRDALLPAELHERRHMDEALTPRARLAIIQYLCDEVAQTDAVRGAVDGALEEIKAGDQARRTERAEYRKQRKALEDELQAMRRAAGHDDDDDEDGHSSGTDEDDRDNDGSSGRDTPCVV
jgi:hypothetical protein